MSGKRFLILGGGVGGVVVASELRNALGREHQVTVVDRREEHVFPPCFIWIMVGKKEPRHCKRSLSLLEKQGINFIRSEIEEIDVARRLVHTGAGKLGYDFLIISMGAQLEPGRVPGFLERAYNAFEMEGNVMLNKALNRFSSGTVVVLACTDTYKCSPTVHEIAFLLEAFFSRRGVRERVDIKVVTPEERLISNLPVDLALSIQRLYKKRGIDFIPGKRVVSIGDRHINCRGRGKIPYDLLVGIPPHSVPEVVEKAGLCGPSGWVEVDPYTFQTPFEDVYAIGDVTAVRVPGGGYTEKSGFLAELQARMLAANLAAAVQGKKPRKRFKGLGFCIVEVGYGKALSFLVDFYAEPSSKMMVFPPSRAFHIGKYFLHRFWFSKWF